MCFKCTFKDYRVNQLVLIYTNLEKNITVLIFRRKCNYKIEEIRNLGKGIRKLKKRKANFHHTQVAIFNAGNVTVLGGQQRAQKLGCVRVGEGQGLHALTWTPPQTRCHTDPPSSGTWSVEEM